MKKLLFIFLLISSLCKAQTQYTANILYAKDSLKVQTRWLNSTDFNYWDAKVDTSYSLNDSTVHFIAGSKSWNIQVKGGITGSVDLSNYYNKTQSDARYLQSYTETDPVYLANGVPQTRTLTGGYGINTIGNFSANRTVSVDSATLASYFLRRKDSTIYYPYASNPKNYLTSYTETDPQFDTKFAAKTTDDLTQGSTNKYFSNTLARNAVSGTGSLSYNSSTGVFSYTQPTNVSTFTNDAGYLTSYSETDALALKIANNLSDLNNASTARNNLGLGTLATQSGTFSGTSSGTNTGDQDLSGYVPVTRTVNNHPLSSNVTVTPTDLSLVVGTNVQAYDADLTTYAGITPSANVQSILSAADYAAMKTLLSINNLDNTSDANKPVSTAQQTALNLKANIASPTFTGTVTIPTPFTLGATSVTSTGTQLNYLNAATGTTGTTSTNLVFSTNATLVTPTLGVASSTSQTITGTGGNGFIELANQSSAPGTPTSASRIFVDASNRLSWKGTNGFVRTFDGTANTADRIYVLPDAAGTVALTSNKLSAFAATTSSELAGVLTDESGTGTFLTTNGSGASLTGITNSNLSGSAGITNANLASPSAYTLQATSGNISAADAANTFFGAISITFSASAGLNKIYIPATGTITKCVAFFYNNGVAGTTETSSIYIRLNNTTDYLVSSAVNNSTSTQVVSNTSMSVPVTGDFTDYVEMKWIAPTWSTNPTNVRISVVMWIQR